MYRIILLFVFSPFKQWSLAPIWRLFFLGGAAPLRSGITDWYGKQILRANANNASSQGWEGCAPPGNSS